jgi:hypothetical protein
MKPRIFSHPGTTTVLRHFAMFVRSQTQQNNGSLRVSPSTPESTDNWIPQAYTIQKSLKTQTAWFGIKSGITI